MITHQRKKNREFPHVSNAIEGQNQEDRHGEIQSMGFRLLDLPTIVIIEILKKMQTEEVLQCRCSCKTLCKLISEPYFSNDFLLKSHICSLVYRSTPENQIRFFRLDNNRPYKTLEHISKRHIPQTGNLEVVGSSKGFLCLWNKSSNANSLYVTNPLLGESVLLPKPLGDKCAAIDETYWFGYIPTTGIFKAIRVRVRKAFLRSNPRKLYMKSEVHALVIGTDTWKYGGEAPFPAHGKFGKTFLNGCLHWMVGEDKDSFQLHSFNMEKDEAHPFAPPPKLGSECSFVELAVVGNYLGLIGCCSGHEHIEVWFMKDYGVASSWTKHFDVTVFDHPNLVLPVKIWKDEEPTFLWFFGLLYLHDSKENKYCGGFYPGSKRKDDVWLYTPSLLSLTHMYLGSGLKVKNKKSYFT